MLVEPADLAGGAAELDVDAAGDVLGGAAQVVLLAGEPALEDVELAAQAVERGERLVDLDDLGRDAVAQPLPGLLPRPQVARAVERQRADRVGELGAAARPGQPVEQDLALAPGVGGELDAGAAGGRRGGERRREQAGGVGGLRAARPTPPRSGRRRGSRR